VGGSYTYLDAEDVDGTPEVLRPKNQASFDVSGTFGSSSQGTFSASVIYNGERLDNDFRNYFINGFVAEKTALGAYTLMRLAAGYRVSDTLELFGRLENALDTDYEEVLSYGTAGRAVYAGVKFVLP
jgi:vitamin B12 transporter